MNTAVNPILRLISGDRKLILPPSDGKRYICRAKDTFKAGIDENFIKLCASNPGVATPETPVQVHEMIREGKLMDIFQSLPGTWNQKWLSQNQLIDFCETLPEWLTPGGYSTFVLIKEDENMPIDEENLEDNLFVVVLNVDSDALRATNFLLGDAYVFEGQHRHRVVSPQCIPLTV